MSNPHKIVLIGFSSFEQSTFESFFRLAARRAPGYLLVPSASEANLAVVNADDAATMKTVVAHKPCAQVMLVGASDGGTGWSLQRRPLNLMKVLANVEQLLGGGAPPAARAATATAPTYPLNAPSPLVPSHAAPVTQLVRPVAAPAPLAAPASRPVWTPAPLAAPAPVRSVPAWSTSGLSPLQDATPRQPTVPVAEAKKLTDQQRNSIRVGAADFGPSSSESPILGAETRPSNINDGMNMDHIMVVDDSDIALKFMRNRLTRFGFRADLVSSGEEALGRLNVRPYKFVFLDVMMEGLDGYQTCRAIKQRKYTEGKPPVVVMLTSRGGTIDKIRGTLAGCDAYLTKPLNERDLIAVLAKHDRSVARGFQETNFGPSVKTGFDAIR